jgi:hypothetical protein
MKKRKIKKLIFILTCQAIFNKILLTIRKIYLTIYKLMVKDKQKNEDNPNLVIILLSKIEPQVFPVKRLKSIKINKNMNRKKIIKNYVLENLSSIIQF